MKKDISEGYGQSKLVMWAGYSLLQISLIFYLLYFFTDNIRNISVSTFLLPIFALTFF